MSSLAYYVSAHGYGHGVRSCDILRRLHADRPDLPLWIVSDHPAEFFQRRLPAVPFRHRRATFDLGMVQVDAVRVDVPATLERVSALHAQATHLRAGEEDFLRAEKIRAVVADIPGVPLAAARRLKRPALACSNFSWDWIYGAFCDRDPRWAPLARWFADDYGESDLLLRLPLHGDMSAFPVHRDIGLVATAGQNRRAELARRHALAPAKRWILLAFWQVNWSDAVLDHLQSGTDYEFIAAPPLTWRRKNIHLLNEPGLPYADLVASCDAVLTKPGFGIVSDCIVNQTPMLYVDRTDFLEYPVLEAGIRRYLKNAYIPAEDFYAGRILPHLDRLWDQPGPTEHLPADGAASAAEEILRRLDA